MHADAALRGQAVGVLGLGIEGRDLARFLLQRGARVTVLDTRPPAAIAAAADELRALGAQVILGPFDAALADQFAALYVSQSVLLQREPLVARMRALGRPVSSMLREFLLRWPGPVAAITGSSGKTTTTALAAAMFARAGVPHFAGGNIGVPLLAKLAGGSPETWAVLEVSHTQLQLLERGPRIGCVTNVTPNHLDQFTWPEYVELKRTLLRRQAASDTAVLNAADKVSRDFAIGAAAHVVWFGGVATELPDGADHCCVRDGWIVARQDTAEARLLPVAQIPLRGAHNVENVLAATAVARAAGIDDDAIVASIRQFVAVPHRLEVVATVGDSTYINDSIATSPERTLAGIRSFSEPLVLLLGGREKSLPLDELVKLANARAHTVVMFGEAGPMFAQAFAELSEAGDRQATVKLVATLAEAVVEAQRAARPGDVVLFSPAGTSFDAYPNFERRGEEFRRLVRTLEVAQTAPDAQQRSTSSPR